MCGSEMRDKQALFIAVDEAALRMTDSPPFGFQGVGFKDVYYPWAFGRFL